MKRQSYIVSNTDFMICPCCGIYALERSVQGVARCDRCDRFISAQLLKTLEQIVSLPDAIGSHACECGHPEMRRLADGVLWCPGCGSEVLPLSASPLRSEPGSMREAYGCGWADGLFGSTDSFVHNEGLTRWEDPHDRLDYYRGHRAGRTVRS
jgi:ribosomal protein L37AE/L43A